MRNRASLPRLAASAVILGCLTIAPLVSAEEPANATQSEESIDEIIVTGSHLSRTDYDGPQPIIVFDRAFLQATGFRDIADLGRYLPQSHQTPSEEENMYSGLAASSWFNLRGLRADSTLTLVNGLRIGCRNCTDKAPPFTHDTQGVNIHDGRGLIWYANWTQTF